MDVTGVHHTHKSIIGAIRQYGTVLRRAGITYTHYGTVPYSSTIPVELYNSAGYYSMLPAVLIIQRCTCILGSGSDAECRWRPWF